MFKVIGGTLLYGLAYHYAYASYISPQFEYAHYLYIHPDLGPLLATYALLLAPLIAYRRSEAPATFGTSLIFALGYVPGQLTLLFCWQGEPLELLAAQCTLAISMGALFAASSLGFRSWEEIYSEKRLSLFIQAITLVCACVLIVDYRDSMRLVGFADVYDLRFEAAEVQTSALTGYLLSWLSYCFLPFLVARGILNKSPPSILWALLGSILIYASSGAKSALLLPFMVLTLHIVLGRKKAPDFLARLLWSLPVAVLTIVLILPDDGIWVWVKSIVLLRTLATGGWVLATYYEYFSTHDYTFYTHIGPVGALTGAYPYGDLSLGQVIGTAYVGSADANFNANFWASDGFAAMGIAGIPVVTAFLCILLYAINRVSNRHSSRLVVLWMTGFWFALLNMPLTTALLSGGGVLTMLLLWSSRLHWGSRTNQSQHLVQEIF